MFMKESGETTIEMAKASLFGRMEINTKVAGKKIRKMDWDYIQELAEMFITGNGKTIRLTEKDCSNGQTEILMMVNGKTTKGTVMESQLKPIRISTMENGCTIKDMERE